MSSPEQIAANRRNAQLSTGPTSENGKQTSSRNALKTGLTGRTVLLPSDDATLYESHLAEFAARYQPVGLHEANLVQSLADTQWRLARIPSLELSIYALGRLEFAALYAGEEDPAVRSALLDAKVYLAYGRQLNTLSIQESRLRRQLEKDAAALRNSRSSANVNARQSSTTQPATTSSPSKKIVRKSSTPLNLGSNFQSTKSR